MSDSEIVPLYARKEFRCGAPKDQIPEEPVLDTSAYRILQDELMLDGRPGLNLATFANTSVDDFVRRLAHEHLNKNFIDHEEYPKSNLAEKRSIWMLAKELGTEFDPEDSDPDTAKGFYGAATIGSSEAAMLALVTHKFAWKKRRKHLQDQPIVLMSAHVHGCFDKFCNYFDVMPLCIPVDEPCYHIDGKSVSKMLETRISDPTSPYAKKVRDYMGYTQDQGERTIGELVMAVVAVIGTTFTGNTDCVKSIDESIEKYCKEYDQDIPLHIDAASGAFILTFSKNGHEVPFNFKDSKRAQSMNLSNHKFGFTCPGMGSVIFRNSKIVDHSLIYDITYLGGNFYDFTLNFSRGSVPILLQYYNFIRYGRKGYEEIINTCIENAQYFVQEVKKHPILGKLFRFICDYEHFPILVYTWAKGIERPPWDLADLSSVLRKKGWIVPAYVLPKTAPDEVLKPSDGVQVLRTVVQQKVSREKLNNLLVDLVEGIEELNSKETKRLIHQGNKC